MDKSGISVKIQSLLNRSWLVAIILFILALILRLTAIGRYITPDELIWVFRSIQFREALLNMEWANTLVAGHPGVITTWLGSLGISLQLLLQPESQEVYKWIGQMAFLTPDNMAAYQNLSAFLSAGRIPVAFINALGVLAVYWLVKKLWGSTTGFLVAFLLAIDPFLFGLSGILHVDGLTTTFVIISLLAILITFDDPNWQDRKRFYLFTGISGASAGFAVLTKSPALVLLPVIGIITLAAYVARYRQTKELNVWLLVGQGLSWLLIFLIVIFLFYPAMWVVPEEVIFLAGGNAGRHAAEALRQTFFMGEVDYDHGFIFYPIALMWRMGPVVFTGLLAMFYLLIRKGKFRDLPWLKISALLIWFCFFLLVISLAAKKFDRYALPVVPGITIVAAIAWLKIARDSKLWRLLLGFVLAIQLIYLAAIMFYPLSAYNLLLGGPLTAPKVMPIGWGEGVSTSGIWLGQHDGVEKNSAISGIAPSLAPFFSGETLFIEDFPIDAADYVIFTANSHQMDPQGVTQATENFKLLKTIRYGFMDQAWVYENPEPEREIFVPQDLPEPVSFDGLMSLIGQDLRLTSIGDLQFTAKWEKQSNSGRYFVKLILKDQNGLIWQELETPLLNEVYFYPEHWLEGEKPIKTYELNLPDGIPPGEYLLVLSLIDELTGRQLPIFNSDEGFAGVVYEVGDISVPQVEESLKSGNLGLTPLFDGGFLHESLQLIGYTYPDRVSTGIDFTLDLAWRAQSQLPQGINIAIQIGDSPALTLPLSRFDSGFWYPGQAVREKYRVPVPATLEDGYYPVNVKVVSSNLDNENENNVILGDLQVHHLDRQFVVPADIAVPFSADFGPGIHLLGMNPIELEVHPDEPVIFILFWQTDMQTDSPISAFVHLLDANGEIVAQIDRWPGGLPSDTWVEGQVIIDEYELALPDDILPGEYSLIVGLYNPLDAKRLEVKNDEGQTYPDNQLLMPLKIFVSE